MWILTIIVSSFQPWYLGGGSYAYKSALGGGSRYLVLWRTIVPKSIVKKPQSTETMLLALWPDQSLNIMALAKIVSDVNMAYYIGETTAMLNVSIACKSQIQAFVQFTCTSLSQDPTCSFHSNPCKY